ncbi:unnamed protein product [Rotaria magnacalcarata]|uniref:Uncharacterized protein n=1 Tax=Rotaria magnacalcarata TaxID=392030 RepID=A0A816QDM7_9BILA|nr:unnamed protein product [Rotaria magnacalcarata]CAF2124840.1 unnamed protein product [Rotaria magnacalcarata]CAF3805783.1 unnamed protein product [Rotaria magnacalcarata]CAF3872074.1 unnamed protein product [Rotaria magnacalcarata]
MASPMKIINFSLGTEKFRYKSSCNASRNLIDDTIRDEFNLANNVKYFLIDTGDNTFVDISSLCYLDDESNIIVEIRDEKKLKTNSCTDMQNGTSSKNRHVHGGNHSAGTMLLSDKNEKLIISDLSSSSSTSESDARSTLHYKNTVSTTGVLKINEAQKRRELKLMCNKKICYFIEKYAKVDRVDSVRLKKEILCNLDLQIHDLYNLLKFIRNKMDLPSLELTKDNLINVLFRIYHNNYLENDCITTTENDDHQIQS